MCPVKVRANTTAFGIINDQELPRQHCDCEKTFMDCLRELGGPVPFAIRNVYAGYIKECLGPKEQYVW